MKNDVDRGGNYPLRLDTEASNSANPITVLLVIQNILKSLKGEMTLFGNFHNNIDLQLFSL